MVDTVIVALPREDDRVHRFSSQKAPHLTLMYLGEEFDMNNLEPVVRYLGHIAKTSLHRFGLSVDRRGTLGDKDADVLFFEDGWQTKELKNVIGYLMADENIAVAYNQQPKKFDKWIPHLTLGYPDNPAKKGNDNEEDRIWYVEFDRIAIWTGDSDGPEFLLKKHEYNDEMAMSDETSLGASFAEYFFNEPILEHYGVKGMQWGKRKSETVRARADAMQDRANRRSGKIGSGAEQRKANSLSKEADRLERRESKREAKKTAKADAAYEKQFEGVPGWVKVNNKVADKINPRLDRMNADHEKKYGNVDLTDPKNKAAKDAYFKAYKKELQASFDEAMEDFGTNASGTKRIKLEVVGDEWDTTWHATMEDLTHAEGDITVVITPKFDNLGRIVDQTFKIVVDEELAHSDAFVEFVLGEEFDELMHYGVKGMKWGVRRSDRVPTGVSVKTTPGRKVKASGGKFEQPSEDAKRTAIQKQKAKKSSTDALSNQELKQMIERMQLEANYDRLSKQSAGNAIVKRLLGEPKYRNQQVETLSKITMPVRAGVNAATGVGSTIRKTDLSRIGR